MCMVLQEHECILERWRWHCACVHVSGRGVSRWMHFWLAVVEEWCWPESVDATNTMDNAGIMNKWFAYRIKIDVNKTDGVARGELAECLVGKCAYWVGKSSKMALSDPQSVLLAADDVPLSVHLRERLSMATEWSPHMPATSPPYEWRFVSLQSSVFVQHTFVAKYVRLGSTWWLKSCVCDQRETGVCKKAPPPFLCAATALAKA